MLSVYYFVRGNGTNACARAAKHALIDKKRKLFLRVYPFGIVAPATMQRTAFEKRRRANTRSVVNGKSFYCRDFCFFFHFYLLEKSFFVLSLVFDHIVGETCVLPFYNCDPWIFPRTQSQVSRRLFLIFLRLKKEDISYSRGRKTLQLENKRL